ncbi:retrovirus-related pol polyprotein from transposon TNT 1-94 [Tanacetum coccineum]
MQHELQELLGQLADQLELGQEQEELAALGGRYSQWHSRFLRYLDTKSNGEYLRKCIFDGPYLPTNVLIAAVEAAENILPVAAHEEVLGMNLPQLVDACNTAKEMWTAIERLQQGESLNVQDVKTNLFWEFGKFTSRDGESMDTWSRFCDSCHQAESRIGHGLISQAVFDVLKHSNAPSFKQSFSLYEQGQSTRHKGQRDAKPVTPQCESVSSEEDKGTDGEIDEQELEAHTVTWQQDPGVSPVESCSTDTPLEQFAPILGYGDLIQGNVTIKRVYYVEGLNHNLFSVGQFCDADLEVAFRKSTCFVRDLQGNDLLTGNRGSDLYTISLQETTSSTTNLKAKRSSFKTKAVPSSKGRLNLLHMDLCGPMRVASINGKKYILVIVDDYSRYTWTLFLRSKDETPEVLKDFLTMIQRNLQAKLLCSLRTEARLVPQSGQMVRYDILTPFAPKTKGCFLQQKRQIRHIKGLEFLQIPLLEEYYDQTTQGLAEENNNDHAPMHHFKKMNLSNPLLYTGYKKIGESSARNIDNTVCASFHPQSHDFPWTSRSSIRTCSWKSNQCQFKQDDSLPQILKYVVLAGKLSDFCFAPRSTQVFYNLSDGRENGHFLMSTDGKRFTCSARRDSALKTNSIFRRYHAGCLDNSKKALWRATVPWWIKLVSLDVQRNKTALQCLQQRQMFMWRYLASCAQVMWMRTQKLQDYGFYYNKIPLYCDSQSAIAIS